jgi:hypothetical protein
MIFCQNKKQEADGLVVQATAVLRASRYHDDNCGKRNCCVSEIIKGLGVDQTTRPRTVVSSAPFRHGCDNNLNDSFYRKTE